MKNLRIKTVIKWRSEIKNGKKEDIKMINGEVMK
jgi:hypothetical protein